jgi:hypothetical protein
MRTSKRVASVMVVLATMAAPGAAWAQTNDYTSPAPTVSPSGRSNDQSVLGSTQTPRAESDDLPFTGADVAQFTVIGLSALGAGFALRRRSRRIA